MRFGFDQLDGMTNEQQILKEAIPEIQNFITQWKFNQKYKNVLMKEFEQERLKQIKSTDNIKEIVQAWLKQKRLSKIRQQIMRSITNFMRYLEMKEAITIRVLKNQLDFQCSIDINNTIGYTSLGIMQIIKLSQTMYKYFNQKKFNQDNIPHKIQLMFQKLYDCLKFLMYRSFDGENKPIDEIDFLIFSQKYLKKKYDKLERKFNFRQDGIVIGGLFTCCYRFFRVLFEFFLSYQQLFLIPDILKRTKQFCQKEEKFIQQVQTYIQQKLNEIRGYQSENKKALDLEKEIENQMTGFQYQNLYQHFIQNASTSTKKIYVSQRSISLYRWQKIKSQVQNLQKLDTSFDQRSSSQPTECSFVIKGLIVLKQDKELQILKLKTRFDSKNGFIFHKDKFEEHQFFYATSKQGKVQIEKSGHFFVITKTSKQLQNVKSMIKQTYNKNQIKITQQSYVLKGHLGLTNLKLKQIVPTPYFDDKIDIVTKERKKNVINKKSRQSTTSVDENKQQQIHSIVYKFKNQVWDQYNYKKQLMKMHILKDGTVMITNVKDRDFAKKQFKRVQKNIYKYLDRAIIKQNQEKKRKQQLDQLMDITVLCYPDQTKLKQGTLKLKQKQYFQNKLSYRDTKTIQQKIVTSNKIISPLKTLKVLTWNVLGYRQYWSIKNKEQQLVKTTDQNQKNKLIKQIKQIYQEQKKRFMQMVNVIKQHDPDIVCLQEAYFLYRFNKQLFQQLLTTNLNGVNYHYAEYNKDQGDFPPVKDGKQSRNERTMILCKFPVKFSNLRSQYKNYSYDPYNNRSHPYSFKLSIIADFQIVLGKQKLLSVLISSVHLKSGNESQDNEIREFQFNYLNKLSQKYDISIFAGDFNSYDKPHITQQSQLSTISQFIRNNGYVDFEKYLISKHPTYRHISYGKSILDKILIKFKDQKIQQRLKVKDIKFPGSFTMQRYEGQSWNITYKDGNSRALSDHIGLFAQFGFSK